MNVTDILFAPQLPWPLLSLLAVLAAVFLGIALWRGLAGWALRALAALVLLAALSGPSLQQEERLSLSDFLLVMVDDSGSQSLSDRTAQSEIALEQIEQIINGRDGIELVVRRLSEFNTDEDGDDGTRLMRGVAEALADVPLDRLAGVITLTDGVFHDPELSPELIVPTHALLTGYDNDWDMRLSVTQAPAFAILGEQTEIRLRIDALGAAASRQGEMVQIGVSLDGAAALPMLAPIGREIVVPVTLDHAGRNLIHLTLPDQPGELTDRNNAAVIEINGVRDRLRVLLVSGTPHPGTRTWRNLLKSDSAVDLVHFTILRPPEKQDGVPVSEVSLIAFPTQELFVEKIDEFDLIIFDRYRLRGILPGGYLDSVRSYVERGGAILVAAGPAFASAESIARSRLAGILPAEPTGQLVEDAFLPAITEAGERHPVTRDLDQYGPEDGWGPWLRRVELSPRSGHTVLSAGDRSALLTLDHIGDGRVALLGSDHAWLWGRGFEGGGPQMELLRRLAHWLMKEPELEEEALSAEATLEGLTVLRRSMQTELPEAVVSGPGGDQVLMTLFETQPGTFRGELQTDEVGLYRIEQGELKTVVVRGAAAPREFAQPVATEEQLLPVLENSGGTVMRIEQGVPGLRSVRAGRPAHGRGWIGYTPRGAYATQSIQLIPLAPAWLMLMLAACALVAAWLVEGRGKSARSVQR